MSKYVLSFLLVILQDDIKKDTCFSGCLKIDQGAQQMGVHFSKPSKNRPFFSFGCHQSFHAATHSTPGKTSKCSLCTHIISLSLHQFFSFARVHNTVAYLTCPVQVHRMNLHMYLKPLGHQ